MSLGFSLIYETAITKLEPTSNFSQNYAYWAPSQGLIYLNFAWAFEAESRHVPPLINSDSKFVSGKKCGAAKNWDPLHV